MVQENPDLFISIMIICLQWLIQPKEVNELSPGLLKILLNGFREK